MHAEFQNFNQTPMQWMANQFSVLFLFLFLTACASKPVQVSETAVSDECEEFYEYIRTQWYQTEGGWYELRKIEEMGGEYNKENYEPINLGPCLGGLHKSEIRALFGQPSREWVVEGLGINSFAYCRSAYCVNEDSNGLSFGRGGAIFFDDNDRLEKIIMGFKDHYQKYILLRRKEGKQKR